MKRYLLIILSFIVFHFVEGQALISGVVKDLATKEPIQYVSVVLSTTYKGTSSNEKGEFTLEIPDYSSNNKFSFQLVGYKPLEVDLVKLMKEGVVYLEVDEQKIDEVTINPINAYNIVQEAIKRIPDNYYSPPVGQDVYFRQILETNEDLSILQEGHFHILNTFNRPKLPKSVSIKKARGFIDMSPYKELGKIVSNNIDDDSLYNLEVAQILLAFNPDKDALTEDKNGIFGENAFKFYEYKYMGMSIKNGHVMHMIQFDQKEGLKKTLYQGTMYIDTVSFAVVEVDASLSPLGIDFQKFIPLKFRLLIKIAGFNIEVKDIAFAAKYEKHGDYWVIDKGSFKFLGSISKRKGEVLNGNLSMNFYVNKNFPKTDFYNVKSTYDVIPSDISKFSENYFFQDKVLPNYSNRVSNNINKKLIGQ